MGAGLDGKIQDCNNKDKDLIQCKTRTADLAQQLQGCYQNFVPISYSFTLQIYVDTPRKYCIAMEALKRQREDDIAELQEQLKQTQACELSLGTDISGPI